MHPQDSFVYVKACTRPYIWGGGSVLISYKDADTAGDFDSRKSNYGYIMTFVRKKQSRMGLRRDVDRARAQLGFEMFPSL
ncbi:hypothetical protein MTR_1g093290 [Medicago truncatula]|uniref:Uncharacterized protein n=1 Tax=Medicago truncatula TaxID=3880 RepID=G7I480_MEDTR|nr:hypothetical protein MTR_1g093290 [Medicago truncatula]